MSSVAMLGLGGCAVGGNRAAPPPKVKAPEPAPPPGPPKEIIAHYAAAPRELYPIPAVDPAKIPERFWRRRVEYRARHAPGTLIVDTSSYYLYLIETRGTAMRYGVSLGRAGFGWSGRGEIAWKRPWPTWTPPDEMIARQPELERWSVRNGGMPPGLTNPLGARALYIFQNGEDTLYRVHGTPEIGSIGRSASSGCVRLINQDIIDLYDRITPGARIIVA